MLSEDIIVEIQEDCSAGSRDSEEETESVHSEPIPTKSCLKKPPVVSATTSTLKKKASSSKKNQKKRKRNHSATAAHKQNLQSVISVHWIHAEPPYKEGFEQHHRHLLLRGSNLLGEQMDHIALPLFIMAFSGFRRKKKKRKKL